MAHQIDFSNRRANLAYVGETPWHGLGQVLTQGASIDEWRVAAGMDWRIDRAPAQYRVATASGAATIKVPERDVLYRSDTLSPLGIVSDGYREVQPGAVLEFFRDLVTAYDFTLDVAGCLFGGKRFWALARTGDESYVVDRRDRIGGYLLLATSADGSLATLAKKTTVRVACNNMLELARAAGGEQVKTSDRTAFNADGVKRDLGIIRKSFGEFMDDMRALAAVPVSRITAAQAAVTLFPTTKKDANPAETFQVQSVLKLFDGQARGSDLAGVHGTAYGFLQAVTEFVDHAARAHNPDNRLNSAWFGRGADLKTDAARVIMELAA